MNNFMDVNQLTAMLQPKGCEDVEDELIFYSICPGCPMRTCHMTDQSNGLRALGKPQQVKTS